MLSLAISGCGSDAPGAEPVVASGGASSTTGGVVAGAGTGANSGSPSGGTTGGTGAAGAGGSAAGSGAGGAPVSDGVVSDVTVTVHDIRTILVVEWTQTMAADETWLEFTFENGEVLTSRHSPGEAGPHREVVLGVPGDTEVTIRIVSSVGGMELKSSDYTGTTGAIPAGMPTPEVMIYEPSLATTDRYLFGAVEDSDGGCTNTACYYHTTFWLYVMDRQGRILWYYSDPASNATSSFQRIARDGEYIWIEKRPFSNAGNRSVLKRTLDGEYSEEIPVANLSDCIDVTDDGSLLYDTTGQSGYVLREQTREGDTRDIWSCSQELPQGFQCYSNTVNWNPLDDTVVLSFPEERTVVEIDRQSGVLVGQYGDLAGSYAFSPDTWEFEYQHFANITPDGTLLLSSHMPGYADTHMPVEGEHAFMEFEIDRDAETLVYKWHYQEGPEWAMFKGMAIRLPNGNTLANYGTGGVIREITPDKETAFMVKFDAEAGDDFFNKMVGNNVLIDDLYALNGGGPE